MKLIVLFGHESTAWSLPTSGSSVSISADDAVLQPLPFIAAKLFKNLKSDAALSGDVAAADVCLFLELANEECDMALASGQDFRKLLQALVAGSMSLPELRKLGVLREWSAALAATGAAAGETTLQAISAFAGTVGKAKRGKIPGNQIAADEALFSILFEQNATHCPVKAAKTFAAGAWRTSHAIVNLKQLQAPSWKVLAEEITQHGHNMHALHIVVVLGSLGPQEGRPLVHAGNTGLQVVDDATASPQHCSVLKDVESECGSPLSASSALSTNPGSPSLVVADTVASVNRTDMVAYSPTFPGAALPKFDSASGLVYARFSTQDGGLLQGGMIWSPEAAPVLANTLALACSGSCSQQLLRLARGLSSIPGHSVHERLALDLYTCSCSSQGFFKTEESLRVSKTLLAHHIKPLLEADGRGDEAQDLARLTLKALPNLPLASAGDASSKRKRPRALPMPTAVIDLSKAGDSSDSEVSSDSDLFVSTRPTSHAPRSPARPSRPAPDKTKTQEKYLLGLSSDSEPDSFVRWSDEKNTQEELHQGGQPAPMIKTGPADSSAAIIATLLAVELLSLQAAVDCLAAPCGPFPPKGGIFSLIEDSLVQLLRRWPDGSANGDALHLAVRRFHDRGQQCKSGTFERRTNASEQNWAKLLSDVDVMLHSDTQAQTQNLVYNFQIAGVSQLDEFCSAVAEACKDMSVNELYGDKLPPPMALEVLQSLADSIFLAWLAAATCCASLARVQGFNHRSTQSRPSVQLKYAEPIDVFKPAMRLPKYCLLAILNNFALFVAESKTGCDCIQDSLTLTTMELFSDDDHKNELWMLHAPLQVLQRAFIDVQTRAGNLIHRDCREWAQKMLLSQEQRPQRQYLQLVSFLWSSVQSVEAMWCFATEHARDGLQLLLRYATPSLGGAAASSLEQSMSDLELVAHVEIALAKIFQGRRSLNTSQNETKSGHPEPRELCFCSTAVAAAHSTRAQQAILDVMQHSFRRAGYSCPKCAGKDTMPPPTASQVDARRIVEFCRRLLNETGASLQLTDAASLQSKDVPASTSTEIGAEGAELGSSVCSLCVMCSCCWAFASVSEQPQQVDVPSGTFLLLARFGNSLLEAYAKKPMSITATAPASAGGLGLNNAQSTVRRLALDPVAASSVLLEVQDLRAWAQMGTTTVLNQAMHLVTTLQRGRVEMQLQNGTSLDAMRCRMAWPIVTCSELLDQPREAHSTNTVLLQSYLSQTLGLSMTGSLVDAEGVLFVATNAHWKSVTIQEAATLGVGHAWCILVRPVPKQPDKQPTILLEVYDSLPNSSAQMSSVSSTVAAKSLACIPQVPDIVVHVVLTELAPAWLETDTYDLISYSLLGQHSESAQRNAPRATGAQDVERKAQTLINRPSLAATQTHDTWLANSCVWMALWHAHLLQQAAASCLPRRKSPPSGLAAAALDGFTCHMGSCQIMQWQSTTAGQIHSIWVAQNTAVNILAVKRFAIQLVSCMSLKVPRAVPVKLLWGKMFSETMRAFFAEFVKSNQDPSAKVARRL